MTGICRLCQGTQELRDSHIIPKFVTRHLKETSATGYLRGAEDPDIRLQDSKKIPLLCDSCEQLFSGWEREFKNQIFDKVKDSDFSQLEYGPWMTKFVVSVSWRVLVSDQDGLCREHPQFEATVNRVSENMEGLSVGQKFQTRRYSAPCLCARYAVPNEWRFPSKAAALPLARR